MRLRALASAVVTSAVLLIGASSQDAHAQAVTMGAGGSASTQTGVSGSAGANGTSATPAGAPAAKTPEEDWAARERALDESVVLSGGVGLVHTQHAQGGVPGQFRLGFTTEFFDAGFLCTSTFPCPATTPGGQPSTSDSMSHIGANISLSATLTKWLEMYLGTSAFANSDEQNRPSLIQVLGDTDLGAKAFARVTDGVYVGGAAELWLINGTGSVGLSGGGTSGKLRGLVTTDLREIKKNIPLRFSINGTYAIDNTGAVLQDVEAARGTPVTRIERYSLGVNRVDHFDINIGGEALLVDERVRPFVEYQVSVPINRQGYQCRANNPSKDSCLAVDPVAPSKLALGARFLPWKRGFSITTAFDIGVTGVGEFIEEVQPQPPWTLYIGAGWAYDVMDRPPVEHVRVVKETIAKKPLSVIKGFVHEVDKTAGVAQAIVAWDNHPEWTALATGTDGRFTTHELEEGPYAFTIHADGFKPGQCSTTLAPGSGDVQLDCALAALPRVGTVIGHVRDAETQDPVSAASIKMVDGAQKSLTGGPDATGSFRFELVSPGTAQITVDAEGYLALSQSVDVKVRQDNTIDLLLQKKPKNPLVSIDKNEIKIKQQVQFALDSSQILPQSNGLLSEIADVLIKNPRIKKVEVQGHTDNSGSPEHNQQLSDARADAVKSWLVSHGVPSDRLVSKGYGQTKPLVPNVTGGNKARNRRVQFIITEQDAAAPTAAGSSVHGGH